MTKENTTGITEFILLGFTVNRHLQVLLFIALCTIYSLAILTNSLVIAIIRHTQSLHKPMYLFIGTFSFLEIWYPTVTVPRFLLSLLTGNKSISVPGCITQWYFHFSLGATETVTLVMMSYDRYVAICSPLHYTTIMNLRLSAQLALTCWLSGFLVLVFPLIQVVNLNFCGPNQIDHYYCDFSPLLMLSCSETYTLDLVCFILSCFILLGSLLVIIASYFCIVLTIVRLPTASGKQKAFSTCASHLTVIAIFYGTTIFMFVKPPGAHAWQFNKAMSIFPSIVTPLLNPIIYTLRNKEILKTLRRGAGKAVGSSIMNTF
ncbi:olfactory receptor 6C4-like [Ambystoma mexicanum]|uniref:olfactory receptor 6C4-like n=1 Tax=Ambystoma mexicanum TaxID=8296 RepID=UPI0037E95238